jgi:hypothetical protein
VAAGSGRPCAAISSAAASRSSTSVRNKTRISASVGRLRATSDAPRPSTAPAMGPSVRPTPVGRGSGVSVLKGSEQGGREALRARHRRDGSRINGRHRICAATSVPKEVRSGRSGNAVTLAAECITSTMTNGARRNCKWQRHIYFTPPDFAASRDPRARAWPMSRRENVFRHVAPRPRS